MTSRFEIKEGFIYDSVNGEYLSNNNLLELLNNPNDDKVSIYFSKMEKLLPEHHSSDYEWELICDEFWELSGQINEHLNIEWYDPDMDYRDDILARFNAIKEYLESKK